jgi:PTS system nitrogen regulatory IIA component
MKSLLQALKDGRLVELPTHDKEKALELLANLIEAIPDIGTKTDLVKSVMEREAQSNTGIGRGVACPHCRTAVEGELRCALGWSPEGIEYGSLDGKPVHIIIMYYVPDSARNAYLKEMSGLAKAISSSDSIDTISSLPEIHAVRERLLDWVSLAISSASPDVKARMIKLEARQAVATAAAGQQSIGSRIRPLRLVTWQDDVLVLSQDALLAEALEKTGGLSSTLGSSREFDVAGYRIAILSEVLFAKGRAEYEAVALLLS